MIDIASLETNKSGSVTVLAMAGRTDIFHYERDESVKRHDGATDDEIESLTALADVAMLKGDISEADVLGNATGDINLLADAVDEMEMTVGIDGGERDAGEAAASAQIEDGRARLEVAPEAGDRQRMKDVMQIQIVYVLTRNDIDLSIPLGI